MKYPNIEALGLNIFKSKLDVDNSVWKVVAADDLEKLLAEAQKVYGRVDGDHGWYDSNRDLSRLEKTHTALLLCIEPIKKGVTTKQLKL